MIILYDHTSTCCGTSVSSVNGCSDPYYLKLGALPHHHYVCDKCHKVTQMIKTPSMEQYFVLGTDGFVKNKYRNLTTDEVTNISKLSTKEVEDLEMSK